MGFHQPKFFSFSHRKLLPQPSADRVMVRLRFNVQVFTFTLQPPLTSETCQRHMEKNNWWVEWFGQQLVHTMEEFG